MNLKHINLIIRRYNFVTIRKIIILHIFLKILMGSRDFFFFKIITLLVEK